MRQVTISVPATSANLGPGFDCLGIALSLRHHVTITEKREPGVEISAEGEDAGLIPRDETNLVYQSMTQLFRRVGGEPAGLHIHQKNEIPIASGLGSSSSAVLAGLFGANELAGSPLSREEVLQLATDLEGHPDNVAPAVYGGLVLGVQGEEGLSVDRLDIASLAVVVVLPDVVLLTEDARAVLPKEVPFADAIFNNSRVGMLIHALQTAAYDRLDVAMHDRLHQPYRIPLVTGMAEAMQAARAAGAAGVALSGAGPSLIAFAEEGHEAIAAAAAAAFKHAGVDTRQWHLIVDKEGTLIQNKP
jgi:homoserine kinase